MYGATFDTAYLVRAVELANCLLEFFFDQRYGGFYLYASDREQLLTRTKEAYDGAMPSGNSVAALVLSQLSRLTGEIRWREAADLHLSWLAGAARYYLCRGGACAQPVDSISELENVLHGWAKLKQ